MKNKTHFLIILLISSVIIACQLTTEDSSNSNGNNGVTANFAPVPGDTWTFMIYLDADNDLETFGIDDFFEMVDGMADADNDNLNLIVQMDRISGWSSSTAISGENWTNTRRYQITSSGYILLDNSLGELNMGDPTTLSNFISYCTTNYSADHYALVLWNHGGGARSVVISESVSLTKNQSIEYTGPEKAICWDETNGDDCLYLDEVRDAIDNHFNSSNKLDLIGFDACLMNTIEVAYEFRDLAEYMAGSMANEYAGGWDYKGLISAMASGSSKSADTKELAKLIVKAYRDSTIMYSSQTQSAVKLNDIELLKTAVDNFAVAIANESKQSSIEQSRDDSCYFVYNVPYYDLQDLANQISNDPNYSSNLRNKSQNVIDVLSNVIVAAYAGSYYGDYYGSGSDVKRGLSIFFSKSTSDYANQYWYTSVDANPYGGNYGFIDFADSDGDGIVETWRELMEYWYDNGTDNTPSSW
ncbi:MAG: clostripain-related cysteine peptidase [Spirochaetes bacterium]|nr:clostripain-related cysteine peptidase [Spirochaetota bacterium]